MFASSNESDTESLIGISVSAVSLLALACFCALCVTILGMGYLGSLLGGQVHGLWWPLSRGFIISSVCVLCFFTFGAWKALYNRRTWALWLARAWAVLLFVFGAADLYHLYHPHVPTPDEYFG